MKVTETVLKIQKEQGNLVNGLDTKRPKTLRVLGTQ